MAKTKAEAVIPPPRNWEEYALRECAAAMGKWLQENGTKWDTPINKLTPREVWGMAWSCCAKYSDLREVERKKMRLSVFDDEALDDLGFVLRRGDRSEFGKS